MGHYNIFFVFTDLIYHFIYNRNRFLSDSNPNSTMNFNRKDSIDVVKFIGRNYCCLMDIIDQLNHCYAFQVNKIRLNAILITNGFEWTNNLFKFR